MFAPRRCLERSLEDRYPLRHRFLHAAARRAERRARECRLEDSAAGSLLHLAAKAGQTEAWDGAAYAAGVDHAGQHPDDRDAGALPHYEPDGPALGDGCDDPAAHRADRIAEAALLPDAV